MPFAESRASKPSFAYDARMMRIAPGSRAFTALTRFFGGIGFESVKCATNPLAWTPASVRDEPKTRTGEPSSCSRTYSTTCCTPTAFVWHCQPE